MPNATSNQAAGNLASYAAGAESYGRRNEVLPSEETMRRELLEVLGYYLEHPDVDASPLEVGQTNSQGEVMKKVAAAAANEDYVTAQAILFREDLKSTPHLDEIMLRLDRLVQVAVRQNTTDSLEFSQAKTELKNHEELAGFYRGGKTEAELILANVSEALSGTEEMGERELEQARQMVKAAIRHELQGNYEQVLPPHRLEGQRQGAKFINRDQNPKLVEYFRLFDALTLELMRQRELAREKNDKLVMERKITLNFLSGLPNLPGVDFNDDLKQRFLKKIAVMDLNQLMYFDYKIQELEKNVGSKTVDSDGANREIKQWLEKDFTPAELHQELEEMKSRNETERERQLEILRGQLRGEVITMPVRQAVHKKDLKRAA